MHIIHIFFLIEHFNRKAIHLGKAALCLSSLLHGILNMKKVFELLLHVDSSESHNSCRLFSCALNLSLYNIPKDWQGH